MASTASQLGPDSQPTIWGGFTALPENTSALKACRRYARSLTRPNTPSASLASPLVLHGPVGTGKSALVHALVREVTSNPAGLTVQVVAASEIPRPKDDTPTGDLLDLHAADLLIVEDLQHLSNRTARVFCRLLDHRAVRRKLTVVTATHGPAGLPHLPRRLTSRLAAGLVVQLEPLSAASRRVFVTELAERRNVRLTADALDWLAGRATGGGLRPLIGSVEQLHTLTRGTTRVQPLDAPAVRGLLVDRPSAPSAEPVHDIVSRVSATFGVVPRDVLGTGRQRAILIPRQVAMYLAREVGKLSLAQVGTAFGGRDHTTVLHACRKVAEAIKVDAKLKRTIRDLKAVLT